MVAQRSPKPSVRVRVLLPLPLNTQGLITYRTFFYTKKRGDDMFYRSYGSQEGQPILFLHGSIIVDTFIKQYRWFKNAYVIVPELIGFGQEAHRIYDLESNIHELHDIMLSCHKKVIVVGYSLGAQLGYVLINRYPELIEKAVLISPWLIHEPKDLTLALEENLGILKKLKESPFLASLTAFSLGIRGQYAKRFKTSLEYIHEETLEHMVNQVIHVDDYDFSKSDIAVLAMVGEHEDYQMHETIQKLKDLNPKCQTMVIEKVFHDIPMRYPKKLYHTIYNFINS